MISENWQRLRQELAAPKRHGFDLPSATIGSEKKNTPLKEKKKTSMKNTTLKSSPEGKAAAAKSETTKQASTRKKTGKYLAIDCEMVGTGPEGKMDALARVSVVNYDLQVLIDEYVKPFRTVTDYRSF